jgi:hypothetical protein
VGGVGLLVENKQLTDTVRLSFKDNRKNDDDAFTGLTELFAKASAKNLRKTANKNQQRKWTELAEWQIMELEVASARTTSVSDVPAF